MCEHVRLTGNSERPIDARVTVREQCQRAMPGDGDVGGPREREVIKGEHRDVRNAERADVGHRRPRPEAVGLPALIINHPGEQEVGGHAVRLGNRQGVGINEVAAIGDVERAQRREGQRIEQVGARQTSRQEQREQEDGVG